MRDVHHIAVRENVGEWRVAQEDEENGAYPSSIYLFDKERRGEQRAHAYASIQCQAFGFETYVMSQFTDEPYVFLVSQLDARSGKVLEEHLEDYN